ncbi:MbcA/ParS/Xre antitoxin family protein [Mangrovicoccus sp. HB161399]|uniref:MbcA/ParS/Xre antitoxin family protein n=1 Tax=Mangrovicoccus sp. HB161399 TaxID=2720392 RepID=UPI0015569FDC|nr:MbcA/ParS/Xre antitoxin family protein [Mangrovicoccus sp. HB161399]
MQILQLPAQPGAEPVPQTIDQAARRRVSGPGLRTFLAIAERYGIATQDQIELLGEPSRSTYFEWVRKAREEAPLMLPLDTLTRISGVLGVHKALGILFPIEAEGMTWLKGPHHGEVFGGQAPVEVMIGGGLDGILTVRRYLDAWRGGLRGGAGFEPVRAQDVVFS